MMEEVNKEKVNDVLIIGAGVTGAALAYVISNYTNLGEVSVLEKYGGPAMVNSHHTQNSQTLHFGDIETNYSYEKAKRVKKDASLVAGYLRKFKQDGLYNVTDKMVLGVGAIQVAKLKERYEQIRDLFPELRIVGRDELFEIEPAVVEGRSEREEVIAIVSPNGYAVDFGALSRSFIGKSKEGGKTSIYYDTLVEDIICEGDSVTVVSDTGKKFKAKFLVIAAGGHSLLLGQKIGLGKDLALMSVAGSFYVSKNKVLNNKVYTMQRKKLPFAALHGDPDVCNPGITRFGPTAMAIPFLERRNYGTINQFHKMFFKKRAVKAFLKFMNDLPLIEFAVRNVIFEIPFVGKWYFLRFARKIVPKLSYGDIKKGLGYGGVRPQVINMKTESIDLGEAKVVGEKVIMNITPSPGASTCLGNAMRDVKEIAKQMEGVVFDEERFLLDHRF